MCAIQQIELKFRSLYSIIIKQIQHNIDRLYINVKIYILYTNVYKNNNNNNVYLNVYK